MNRILIIILCITVALLGHSDAARSQIIVTTSGYDSATPAKSMGTIIGKVIDARTHQIVRDITIKMVNETGSLTVLNAPDGQFTLVAPCDHNYVITADKDHFVSTRAQVSTEGMSCQYGPGAKKTILKVTIYVDSLAMGLPRQPTIPRPKQHTAYLYNETFQEISLYIGKSKTSKSIVSIPPNTWAELPFNVDPIAELGTANKASSFYRLRLSSLYQIVYDEALHMYKIEPYVYPERE